MGFLVLQGGAEFGGAMAHSDLRAIALAGGPGAPIRIVPTAAAPDKNEERAGNNGVRWFESLGAQDVCTVPLIDKASANHADVVAALAAARLIYLLGGFPDFLAETLDASRSWKAILKAYRSGAVLAGSSAGAMVLGGRYYEPRTNTVQRGLALLPHVCIIPHHNTSGRPWVSRLAQLLPEMTLLALDEQTGIVDEGPGGRWQVYGQGAATLYGGGRHTACPAGHFFELTAPLGRKTE